MTSEPEKQLQINASQQSLDSLNQAVQKSSELNIPSLQADGKLKIKEQYIDIRNTLINRTNEQRNQQNHKKRLEQISNRQGVEIGLGQISTQEHLKYQQNKRNIHVIRMQSVQQEIERNNQRILRKLVEISTGRLRNHMATVQQTPQSQIVVVKKQETAPILGKSQSQTSFEYRAKSLHFNARKQELERIERENQKIARKIYTLKSDLQRDRFEQDFQHHSKYKQNILKIRKKVVTLPTHAVDKQEKTSLPSICQSALDSAQPELNVLGSKTPAKEKLFTEQITKLQSAN